MADKLSLSNFIVDRVLSGIAYQKDEEGKEVAVLNITQCQNTSITCGSESTDIVDNVGSPILTLYRSKTCEVSGENAILDFNLTALQMGTAKNEGAMVVPAQEILEAKDGACTLKNVPSTSPAYIYTLNDDSSLGAKYRVATDADAEHFAITGKAITLPTGVADGTQVFVSYEYEATSAMEIINSAKEFPKSCKLVLRVLGFNPCNKENKLGAYIIFPSFQMSPDFDLSLNAGEAQSWSGKATQDYCSKDKALMRIVVVDEDDDTF